MKNSRELCVEQALISTPEGQMPVILYTHSRPIQEGGLEVRVAGLQNPVEPQPAVLLLMEAFGLTSHIQAVAARIAKEGYVVLIPDLYYRDLPNNKFRYDEVDKAMAMMYRLDLGQAIEDDLQAALNYLQSRSDVYPDKIGVTGFCLGGGLSFLAACKFSDQIAVAAPFYGMVLDDWIGAMAKITVPIYLFFGGADPFISGDRIHQIETRFQELGTDYRLKIYPDADHGFFCNERSSYNRAAAEDAWRELIQFFRIYLQEMR